jgi:hypothetical protein
VTTDDLASAAPENELFSALAGEVVSLYGGGRPIIAIDGPAECTDTQRFGDALTAALRDAGRSVARASLGSAPDSATVRSLIVVPFRAGGEDILVVDGAGLLADGLRDLWHHTTWLESPLVSDGSRDETLRLQAHAIVDTRDPGHPRRIFADFC